MTEKYNKSSIELEIKLFRKFTKLSIKKVTASLLSGKNSSRKRKNTKAAWNSFKRTKNTKTLKRAQTVSVKTKGPTRNYNSKANQSRKPHKTTTLESTNRHHFRWQKWSSSNKRHRNNKNSKPKRTSRQSMMISEMTKTRTTFLRASPPRPKPFLTISKNTIPKRTWLPMVVQRAPKKWWWKFSRKKSQFTVLMTCW